MISLLTVNEASVFSDANVFSHYPESGERNLTQRYSTCEDALVLLMERHRLEECVLILRTFISSQD